jgi:hypothetical protein
MFVCWPVVTLLYYGISFSVDKISLTDNVFVRQGDKPVGSRGCGGLAKE